MLLISISSPTTSYFDAFREKNYTSLYIIYGKNRKHSSLVPTNYLVLPFSFHIKAFDHLDVSSFFVCYSRLFILEDVKTILFCIFFTKEIKDNFEVASTKLILPILFQMKTLELEIRHYQSFILHCPKL